MKYTHRTLLASTLFALLPGSVLAAPDTYGWELMSEQERVQHRERMQNCEAAGDCEQYRMEHHQRMQERAKQRGVTLPDQPRPRGQGTGMGMDRDGMGGNGRGR